VYVNATGRLPMKSMKPMAKLDLRTLCIGLSALLLLLLLWGGGRLLFLSAPDPVLPVASALRSDVVNYRAAAPESRDIVERPLFWQGREAYVYKPPAKVVKGSKEQAPPGDEDINKMKLVGVYAGEKSSGVVLTRGRVRHRVAINKVIAGWRLKLVRVDSAVFHKNGSKLTMQLEHANPKGGRGDRGKDKTRGQQASANAGKKPGNTADKTEKADEKTKKVSK
jgi:hypothetical protein